MFFLLFTTLVLQLVYQLLLYDIYKVLVILEPPRRHLELPLQIPKLLNRQVALSSLLLQLLLFHLSPLLPPLNLPLQFFSCLLLVIKGLASQSFLSFRFEHLINHLLEGARGG